MLIFTTRWAWRLFPLFSASKICIVFSNCAIKRRQFKLTSLSLLCKKLKQLDASLSQTRVCLWFASVLNDPCGWDKRLFEDNWTDAQTQTPQWPGTFHPCRNAQNQQPNQAVTGEQNSNFSLLSDTSCKYVFGLFANTNARKLTRAARQQQKHRKKPHQAVDIKISHPEREKREEKHKFTSRDLGEFVTAAKKKKKFHSGTVMFL